MTTPSPGDEQLLKLQLALDLAARDPSPERIAAALRLMPDSLIGSECGRRSSRRRNPDNPWLVHHPGVNFCRCPACILDRNQRGFRRRHKHKPLTDSHRPAAAQSPGCRDPQCKLSHVIVRCECGALGVICTKNPTIKWRKPKGETK